MIFPQKLLRSVFPLLVIASTATAGTAVSWQQTGMLNVPRAESTATTLTDGRVLVTGGSSANVILTSAEIYDPATGSWSTTGNMATARREHIATRLADGTVLIAGGLGSSGEALISAEVYHPATGTFTSAGNMTVARSTNQVAASLPDGRALVTGGALPRQDDLVDIYDPATATWSATSSLPDPLLGVTLTTLQDGKVLAKGGSDIALGILSKKAYLYNPATGLWTETGDLLEKRRAHRATARPKFTGCAMLVRGTRLRDHREWQYRVLRAES